MPHREMLPIHGKASLSVTRYPGYPATTPTHDWFVTTTITTSRDGVTSRRFGPYTEDGARACFDELAPWYAVMGTVIKAADEAIRRRYTAYNASREQRKEKSL